jgi:hypothetical protein
MKIGVMWTGGTIVGGNLRTYEITERSQSTFVDTTSVTVLINIPDFPVQSTQTGEKFRGQFDQFWNISRITGGILWRDLPDQLNIRLDGMIIIDISERFFKRVE